VRTDEGPTRGHTRPLRLGIGVKGMGRVSPGFRSSESRSSREAAFDSYPDLSNRQPCPSIVLSPIVHSNLSVASRGQCPRNMERF
jgi:hypothetical protein